VGAEPGATTLTWYLDHVGRTPLRTAAEEVDLAKRIRAATAASALLGAGPGMPEVRARLRLVVRDGQRAATLLTEANLRLVVSMARRYQGRGLDLLDLVQEGNLGLLTAVERFDPGRGFRFSTYASWWIRQAITRGLATRGRAVRLPVHAYEVLTRLRHVELDLWQQHGVPPSDVDLAAALEITPARLREIRQASRDLVSLDLPVGEDGSTTLGALVVDAEAVGPEDVVTERGVTDALREALQALQPRDREILERRYGLAGNEPQTLEQIGRHLGLTRERIRQIELRALGRLASSPRAGLVDAVGA
jgi:RNA polymerase sigma factor (sigma-70 family)